MTEVYFEEEEFTTQFNGRTFKRILGLTRQHSQWVVGFLVTIALVSALDSYFTFLSKQIVDQAIVPGDTAALVGIVTRYASLLLVQAVFVFTFIYLAGVLGERIRYDLRQVMFNHLQQLSLSYYNQTPVGWIMSRVTSNSGSRCRARYLGAPGCHLGGDEHPHRHLLHAVDKLAAGLGGHAQHSGHDRRCRSIPEGNPG